MPRQGALSVEHAGGLPDATDGSWTVGDENAGDRWPGLRVCESTLIWRSLVGVARRAPGGPPKAEPGADAGPAAPQAPP